MEFVNENPFKREEKKEEVKEEYRQQEGDPHVKARQKQIRAEKSRRRTG